jgi:hypothetical protein
VIRQTVSCLILLPALLLSADQDRRDWQALQHLKAGQRVEVSRKQGQAENGALASVTDESLTLRTKQSDVTIARADVARVIRRGSGRAKWYGLAAGAAAGAVTGAAAGTRLANESGGDFDVKGVTSGVVAVAGGLIGLAIGASLDARRTTIYESK